jgi:hypothetical protein
MRKLILSLVFVLATGTVMNASSNDETLVKSSCFQEAWDFGTEEGGGDETKEWERMNAYYTMWCMN